LKGLMMAMTIFMHQAPGSVKRSLAAEFEIKLLHRSMEYSNLLRYKRRGVSRRARGTKNGAGPVKRTRAAGISHRRGSWLACRREMLLNRPKM
jgi:hypothetical protein